MQLTHAGSTPTWALMASKTACARWESHVPRLFNRASKDHINVRILQNIIAGIPLHRALELELDPFCLRGLLGPIQAWFSSTLARSIGCLTHSSKILTLPVVLSTLYVGQGNGATPQSRAPNVRPQSKNAPAIQSKTAKKLQPGWTELFERICLNTRVGPQKAS